MKQQDVSSIAETIITKQTADMVLFSLQKLKEICYTKQGNLSQYIQTSFSQEIAEIVTKLLGDSLTQTKPETMYETLIAFEEILTKIPVIQITFAIHLSKDMLLPITKKIITCIGAPVLIDVCYDESIIAGTLLQYNGMYKDYSVRAQFQK